MVWRGRRVLVVVVVVVLLLLREVRLWHLRRRRGVVLVLCLPVRGCFVQRSHRSCLRRLHQLLVVMVVWLGRWDRVGGARLLLLLR